MPFFQCRMPKAELRVRVSADIFAAIMNLRSPTPLAAAAIRVLPWNTSAFTISSALRLPQFLELRWLLLVGSLVFAVHPVRADERPVEDAQKAGLQTKARADLP